MSIFAQTISSIPNIELLLVHSIQQKRTTCSGRMKTGLNNVLLPTLFNVVNNIVQHCYTWLQDNSGSTLLNNIVDHIEQCWQQNIIQDCFHQAKTGCSFFCLIWGFYVFHFFLSCQQSFLSSTPFPLERNC